MNPSVFTQVVPRLEPFVTNVAGVRAIVETALHLRAAVSLQIIRLRERFETELALMRAFSRVREAMLVRRAVADEAFGTQVARERALASVDADVFAYAAAVFESFAALDAEMRQLL